jgi:trans-2,3-dihydro-3-hydroxyanthranilate isomerase
MAPSENAQLHFEIEQGVEMGLPSLLIASGTKTVEGPVEATVGGGCVLAGRGTLEV